MGYVAGKKVSYYIDQAGGFASDAKKRQTYILYMNGSVARVGHDAKVEPGCEIFVPTKAQSKMSLAENWLKRGIHRRRDRHHRQPLEVNDSKERAAHVRSINKDTLKNHEQIRYQA